MTATVIALVTLREDQQLALSEYLRVTEPLLKKAGGRVVKRFEINEVIVGHRPARSVVIVEYPDRAAVDSVFESPEYKGIIPVRDIAFADYHVSIVET
ncbi:MAG: hypothetical protein HLUCCA08_17785 [Rhodobacteraceae bacterium HLUCCA08]|nr:MAG: hypothetical protein HLUCCA08_17785 [Rhodobacteraceae bacterium HLUCCA08]